MAEYTEEAKYLESIQVANWEDLFFLQRWLNDLAVEMSTNADWAPAKDILFDSLFHPIMGAIEVSKISYAISADPVGDHLVRTLRAPIRSVVELTIISAQAMSTQEQVLALAKERWASGKDLYDQILRLWEQ